MPSMNTSKWGVANSLPHFRETHLSSGLMRFKRNVAAADPEEPVYFMNCWRGEDDPDPKVGAHTRPSLLSQTYHCPSL